MNLYNKGVRDSFIKILFKKVSHVLCWHLQLILSKRIHSTQSYIRVRDVVLSCRKKFKIIALLQDGTVVRRDIEEERDDVFLFLPMVCLASHGHFVRPTQSDASDLVSDYCWKVSLINDGEDVVGPFDSICHKASILDHKDVILIR